MFQQIAKTVLAKTPALIEHCMPKKRHFKSHFFKTLYKPPSSRWVVVCLLLAYTLLPLFHQLTHTNDHTHSSPHESAAYTRHSQPQPHKRLRFFIAPPAHIYDLDPNQETSLSLPRSSQHHTHPHGIDTHTHPTAEGIDRSFFFEDTQAAPPKTSPKTPSSHTHEDKQPRQAPLTHGQDALEHYATGLLNITTLPTFLANPGVCVPYQFSLITSSALQLYLHTPTDRAPPKLARS